MRRPKPRALLVGLLALSVLSLSVQHAIYLCGLGDHGDARASSGTAARAGASVAARGAEPAHAGCHEAASPSPGPADERSAPACCGTESLASLPSVRDPVCPDGVAPLSPACNGPSALLAFVDTRLHDGARSRTSAAPRVRPHLVLQKILV